MTDETPSLTDKAVERLRKLADGNGMPPDAIELAEKNETTYTVTGTVKLTPKFESNSRSFPGVVKGKNRRVVANFAALQQEVEQQKKKFLDTDPWLDAALKDLHAAPGFGWGMQGAKITLPEHTYVLSATETCPVCVGKRLLTCAQCAGKKNFICRICNGTREEMCPNCYGNGQDPTNNELPCPICRGVRRISCRNCRGTGLLPCPTCQGQGGTPCGNCNSTGALSQEVTMEGSAEVEFKLGAGTHLPAGLLRALDRLGLENLSKGHGDITIIEAQNPDEEAPDKKILPLSAKIPYADIKLRFNGKGALISSFGKRGALFGVPPFLDEALKPWRDYLKNAVHDSAMLDKALEVRAMQDALKIELAGSGDVTALRRLYSVGMLPATAAEIMRDIRLALRNVTRRARMIAAGASVTVSAGIFLALYFTTLRSMIPPQFLLPLDIMAPLAMMTVGWLAVQQSSQHTLRRKFQGAVIKAASKGGNIGLITVAIIFLAYALILFLAPHRPDWLTHLLH